MKRKPVFKTESALCVAFATVATAAGWTVYNETEGWDQLLVNAGGEQIGVHAKLRANVEVVAQALRGSDTPLYGAADPAPDWRLVLVGIESRPLHDVCRFCKLILVFPGYRGDVFFPDDQYLERTRWPVTTRHPLPKYLPDVPAGVPSPVQLTAWKISAIRLCCILRSRGVLTSKDFKAEGVDYRRWIGRWLEYPHKTGEWRQKPGARLPDEDHPTVAAQIAAELNPVKSCA